MIVVIFQMSFFNNISLYHFHPNVISYRKTCSSHLKRSNRTTENHTKENVLWNLQVRLQLNLFGEFELRIFDHQNNAILNPANAT